MRGSLGRPKSFSLTVALQPKQKELRDLVYAPGPGWIGYGGSRGGAKSAALRRVMLLRRIKCPQTAGMLFRRTYPELLDNHITKMWLEFPELERFYSRAEKSLVLPNGSRVDFRYAESEADIAKFMGKEYMDIFVDQAEGLTGAELVRLRSSNRWPSPYSDRCKMVLSFNPGGRGTDFLKRVFRDRRYADKERADDYAFIQARGWDNVEWSRRWLEEHGVSAKAYYAWDEDRRRTCFLENSEYGRQMDALPAGLRAGWLDGDFDSFSGQYFDCWEPATHVVADCDLGLEPWSTRWIAIDWGFAHNCAVLWFARTPLGVCCYRELVVNRRTEGDIATEIAAMSQGEDISGVYLSPDAKAKRGSARPTKEQIGDALTELGLPYPADAENARVAGWRRMYALIASGQFRVSPRCPRLIEQIPLMARDPANPEDCEKFDCDDSGRGGDDAADCCRYGLMTYPAAGSLPAAERMRRALEFTSAIADPAARNTMAAIAAARERSGERLAARGLRRCLRRR